MLWHIESREDIFFNPVRNFVPTENRTRTWEVLLRRFTTTAKALSLQLKLLLIFAIVVCLP
jgi:hypothetical protein